jgi:hypothetical protein
VKDAMKADSWKSELKSQLKYNADTMIVVLLLPGKKGTNNLYDEIKKFLLVEYPVPSQVVLCNTISKGKHLHSIVSKILI